MNPAAFLALEAMIPHNRVWSGISKPFTATDAAKEGCFQDFSVLITGMSRDR